MNRCRSARASGRTDANAQVCDAAGKPIAGLYAVGNDMQSVMGGEYPGAGAMLGPGMTFGYLVVLHAVRPSRRRLGGGAGIRNLEDSAMNKPTEKGLAGAADTAVRP